MKDYWIEPKEKSLNKKKIIMLIVILILTISITTITIIYINNRDFREWMDKNLFRKEILQDNATIIELKDENSKIYAFNKNIGILSKNSFDIYNNNGSKEKSLEIETLATKCGYFPIFRYNPVDKKLYFDSKNVDFNLYTEFLLKQRRYKSLEKINKDEATKLFETNKENAIERFNYYKMISEKED